MEDHHAELMKKTKRELIELFQENQQEHHQLEKKYSHLENEISALEKAMASLRNKHQQTHETLSDNRTVIDSLRAEIDDAHNTIATLENEKKILEATMQKTQTELMDLEANFHISHQEMNRIRTAYEAARREIATLQEKNGILSRENTELAAAKMDMENRLMEARSSLDACESQYQSDGALFQALVGEDAKRILLIDPNYAVTYANRSASSVLDAEMDQDVTGKRLFDFMIFKDAVRVKDKIDKTFLAGETEKVKKVHLRRKNGNLKEVKLKMYRLRLKDRPAVKIVVQ